MPQARSIHIGLNFVDPNAYGGWDGQLSGCINDANAMEGLAQSVGYQTQKLIDAQATSHNVIAAIGQAASQMTAGDILMVTYSGHGGQVFDATGDEADSMDETWCLWDRQLIDDELFALWRQFAEKVRIVLISDSCHSGTVARLIAADAFEQRARSSGESYQTGKAKALDPDIQAQLASRDMESYNTYQWLAGDPRTGDMRASLILI